MSLVTPPTSPTPSPGTVAMREYAKRQIQAGRPVSLGAMLRILLDTDWQAERARQAEAEIQARQAAEMQP